MYTLSGLIGRVETNWVGTSSALERYHAMDPFAHGEIPCQGFVRYRASMGYKGKPIFCPIYAMYTLRSRKRNYPSLFGAVDHLLGTAPILQAVQALQAQLFFEYAYH